MGIYSKLAQSGWLGTKAQVADQYGTPVWKDDPPPQEDAQAIALKRAMNKKPAQDDDSSGS